MFLTGLWVSFALSYAARDVGRAVFEPPWMMAAPRFIVLADGVDPRWLDSKAPPQVEEQRASQDRPLGVYRPVLGAALPAATAQWIGARVILSGMDSERPYPASAALVTCGGRISALWAASIAPTEDNDSSLFAAAVADAIDQGDHLAAAEGWALGHPLLVAEVARDPGASCPNNSLVATPGGPNAERARRLDPIAVPPKVRAAALKAVRATELWHAQQDAYAASLAAWRKDVRALSRAERRVQLEQSYGVGAPKRWDRPGTLMPDERPDVDALVDAAGMTRLIEVELGNAVSCAAPRLWFVLEPATYRVLDSGVARGDRVYLDWDGDGALDVLEYGWETGAVVPLGHARAALQAFTVRVPALHCPAEAVPPLGQHHWLDDPNAELPEP